MKGKSWQRYSVAVIMIIGYFMVIAFAYHRGDSETAKSMAAALVPVISAVTSVWIYQAGTEKQKGSGNE